MKASASILLILASALLAGADGPAPFRFDVDSRYDNVPGLQAFRSNEVRYIVRFLDGGAASDLTNSTPFLIRAPNFDGGATHTAAVAFVGSCSTGIVAFTFAPAMTDSDPGNYVYEVGVIGSNGNLRTYRNGALTISGSLGITKGRR